MPKGLNNVCSPKCAKEKEKLKNRAAREKKKESISTLTKVLDSIFSQYIRLREVEIPQPVYGEIFRHNVWLGFILLAGIIWGI